MKKTETKHRKATLELKQTRHFFGYCGKHEGYTREYLCEYAVEKYWGIAAKRISVTASTKPFPGSKRFFVFNFFQYSGPAGYGLTRKNRQGALHAGFEDWLRAEVIQPGTRVSLEPFPIYVRVRVRK